MLLLLAMIAVFNLSAEPLMSVPVATLNHNGQFTQYNGGNALIDAHNAAVSGDVITLNNGIFNACTITKGITLRGACMGTTPEMQEQGMRPTIIQNEMHIQVPSTETNTLKIEDLQFYNRLYVDSVPHISFARVHALTDSYTRASINNFDAVQCMFYRIMAYNRTAATVYSFVNSTIAIGDGSTHYCPPHVYADHCVIGHCATIRGNENFYGDGQFKNCIFTYYKNPNMTGSCIPGGYSAQNCVAVNSGVFSLCNDIECKEASLATLFDDQEHTGYSDGNYINPLTEEAAATYLGTDGSQVGVYGGILPFTMMPFNPIVTKCDIAGQTTQDGKLKVQIEVKSVW